MGARGVENLGRVRLERVRGWGGEGRREGGRGGMDGKGRIQMGRVWKGSDLEGWDICRM